MKYHNDQEDKSYEVYDAMGSAFLTYHLFFVFGTFVFDIHKWIVFIISTNDLNKSRDASFLFKIEQRRKRIATWILTILQILLVLLCIAIVIGVL